MNQKRPDMPRFPKLTSMSFAMVLMGVTVLLMLCGVLPVRGGGQNAMFRSPVLMLVLGLLGISTMACALRRRLSLRSVGFHLTHVSVVVVMLGALIGVVFENKFDCQLNRNTTQPLQKIRMGDGSIVDLGFGLSLKSFRVEKYPPSLLVFRGDEQESEHRLSEGTELQVAGEAVTVVRVVPHAEITNIRLKGSPELVVGEADAPWARISLDGTQPREMALPGGSSLVIARAFNNLPTMQMGSQFRETVFPSRPGLIVRVIASNSMAVLSLPADEDAEILSPSDLSMAPPIPRLRYLFPEIEGLDVAASEDPDAPFLVELAWNDGRREFLVASGESMGSCRVGQDYTLALGHRAVRWYDADIVITREGEAPVDQKLVINSPVDVSGWRIYLSSYDVNALQHISITLRKDPGNAFVELGLLGLMIGTMLIFFTRKRKSS